MSIRGSYLYHFIPFLRKLRSTPGTKNVINIQKRNVMRELLCRTLQIFSSMDEENAIKIFSKKNDFVAKYQMRKKCKKFARLHEVRYTLI